MPARTRLFVRGASVKPSSESVAGGERAGDTNASGRPRGGARGGRSLLPPVPEAGGTCGRLHWHRQLDGRGLPRALRGRRAVSSRPAVGRAMSRGSAGLGDGSAVLCTGRCPLRVSGKGSDAVEGPRTEHGPGTGPLS